MYRNYIDKKLTVDNVKQVADILSHKRYELDLIWDESCETCGDWNSLRRGVYDGVEIEYLSHCFGKDLTFSISDEELVIKLKEWINYKELARAIYYFG